MYFIATVNLLDNGLTVYALPPILLRNDNNQFILMNNHNMQFLMQFSNFMNSSFRFYLFYIRENNNNMRLNYLNTIRNYIQFNIYDENIYTLISQIVTFNDINIQNNTYSIIFTSNNDYRFFDTFNITINENHPNYNILLNP